VGNFYPHKNVDNLIRAYQLSNVSLPLILVGPQDHFSGSLKQLILQLGLEEKILFYHNATMEDLAYFYTKAKALIHPTLSEGFGLPLIEAAFFKLPVIASNIPVIAELLGSSYTKFDPFSVQDIAQQIKTFSQSSIQADYGRLLETYSFSNMARKTLDLYRRTIS
jgi:glycosyltransferase involved in cell wall biosynthesis